MASKDAFSPRYNGEWIECSHCDKWRFLHGKCGIELADEYATKPWRCALGGDGRTCRSRLTKREKVHSRPEAG